MTEESEDNSTSLQPRRATVCYRIFIQGPQKYYAQKTPEMNVSEWDLIPEKNHEKILDNRKVRARNASDKKKFMIF